MSYVPPEEQDESLAPGVVEAARRYPWIVILGAAVGLVLALGVTKLVLPARYVARATITIEDPQQSIFSNRGPLPLDFERYINGTAAFITSTEVLDRAVDLLEDGTDRRDLERATKATAAVPERALGITVRARGPRAAAARAEAIVEAFRDAQEERLADEAEKAIDALGAQQVEADQAVADASAALSAAPDDAALAAVLDTAVDRAAALRGRADEITVNAEAFGDGVDFVEGPNVPSSAASPKTNVNLAIGLLGGLLAGFLLAWWYADRHRGLWTSDEPALVLGAPLLAKVVTIPRNHPTLADPEAMPAEPYQFVTSAVLAAVNHPGAVILVSSADAGAGKSVAVANVAVAAAIDERRVAVVDACRNEGLAALLGVPARQKGLLEAMASDDDVTPWLRTVDVGGWSLQFLPFGTTSPLTAVNALRSDAGRRVIEQLQRQFDLVLVDCPGLLSSAVATALASWADGIVLVVRRKTNAADLMETQHRIAVSGVPLIGYVYTKAAWREPWHPAGRAPAPRPSAAGTPPPVSGAPGAEPVDTGDSRGQRRPDVGDHRPPVSAGESVGAGADLPAAEVSAPGRRPYPDR